MLKVFILFAPKPIQNEFNKKSILIIHTDVHSNLKILKLLNLFFMEIIFMEMVFLFAIPVL